MIEAPQREAPRVLVVEDEVLIGLDLVQALEDAGYETRGPFRRPEDAVAEARVFRPHLAVLDINLGGDETSEPVAEHLRAEATPFVFLTGYAVSASPVFERFPEAPRLSKPVDLDALTRMLGELLR